MLPRPGPDPGDLPGLPAARAWRLPVRYRVTLIVIQALLPGIAGSLFWAPLRGNGVLPAPLTWLILAAALAAWAVLAARAWRESAILTPDLLVVRNVFRTRRIPVEAITVVRISGPWAALTVSAARPGAGSAAPPVPAPPALAPPAAGAAAAGTAAARPGGRHAGRHQGGRPVRVAAATLGGAQWTGRRAPADDLADAIAAAAGLPPVPPRKELISKRAARIMAPAGLALGFLGAVIKGQPAGTFVSVRAVLGTMVLIAGGNLLIPALLAMLDRFCGRWARPPAPPAADGGPSVPAGR